MTYLYTKDLQITFQDLYQKFYRSYDLVLSVHHIFIFGNHLGKGSASLNLRQKLPHKLYLGVNFNDSGQCSFDHVVACDYERKVFFQSDAHEYLGDSGSIQATCSNLLNSLQTEYGMKIGVLTEYPKGRGTSMSQMILSLFVAAIFLKEGKLPLESLQNYAFQYTNIYKDMAYLSTYLRYLMNSEEGLYTPLLLFQKNNGPVIKIGNIDFSTIPQVQIQGRLLHLSSFFDKQNQKETFGLIGLNSFAGDSLFRFPLDYAIIYIGEETESISDKEQAVHNKSIKDLVNRTSQLAYSHGINIDIEASILSPKEVYNHFNSILQMNLFHKIIACLDSYNEDTDIKELIITLQDMGFYHCFIEHQYEMISRVYNAFALHKSFPDEICACVPLTTVKMGGTFLVVLPRHQPKQTIDTMIGTLTENYGYAPTMLYASWKEWFMDSGLQVTQYLSKSLYSSHITPGTVELILGSGKTVIGDYDTLVNHSSLNDGISFDLLKKKIWVNGEKINYKTICSQSATIEILLFLFARLGECVPNHLLPASTYSKNKNEMISKIILPLQQLITKQFGEQLEIQCSGTLYERTICLKNKPSCIHLLKQVK